MTGTRVARSFVVAAVAAFAVWTLRGEFAGGRGASESDRAPRFVAATIDAAPAPRSLDDYAGQPLLLNVWATWCDPCREEMPSFERLYADYRGRGLRIVAVSVDDDGTDDLLRDFVRENALTFDVLHDKTSAILTQFHVRGVPQTFLISRSGRIVGTRFAADWSSAASRALVDSLLRAED
jgi:peroxiredoxin